MRASGRPTMVDVAARAGVSLKTVSRVVNGEGNVDPAMATRVRDAADALGYHRNAIAASLRSGARDTIGFVSADLSNTFYMAVAAAVTAVAATHRMQLIMASSEEDPVAERRLALDLCQRRVGGLILVPTAADHGYLAAEVERGTPVVFLDRPGSGLDADAVMIDNRGGAYAAVGELLAAGHERIAMLFDALDIYTMRERRAGALAAFADAGRRPDPALEAADVHTPAAARASMERMLRADPAPTAVFCGNNRATIGALTAIVAADARVEISGFDDFETSEVVPRSLRIVDYDVAALGTIAAETLLARIAGAPAASPTLLPTRLVTRGAPR